MPNSPRHPKTLNGGKLRPWGQPQSRNAPPGVHERAGAWGCRDPTCEQTPMYAHGCLLIWGQGWSLLWDTHGGPWPQRVRTLSLEHQGWEELQDSVREALPVLTRKQAPTEISSVQGHVEAGLQARASLWPPVQGFTVPEGCAAIPRGQVTGQIPAPTCKGTASVFAHCAQTLCWTDAGPACAC